MLIKNIMIPVQKLTVISIHQTVGETLALINEEGLLSLPVAENHKFVGVISKNYLYEKYFEMSEEKESFLNRKVSEFMEKKLPCLEKNVLVEEAVDLLLNAALQFIPVVNKEGEFCGIVTHKAVFSTFKNALGIGHTRLAITTYDMKGRLAKLAELIAKEEGNIVSIVEVDPKVMDLKELIIRVDVTDTEKLVKTLSKHGFTVRRVDH